MGKSPRGPARQWVTFNKLKKNYYYIFFKLITHCKHTPWRSYRKLAVASANLRTFRQRLGNFSPLFLPFLLSSFLLSLPSFSPFIFPFSPHVEKNRPQLLDWKKANVTPIYKNKRTKSQPCNYRPVSLTSHISKTMESIIRDEIIRHLQKK